MDQLAVEFVQCRAVGVAKIARATDDQVEHRLRIAGRGRHHLQHVDGRGLMLDPLAVFAVALRPVPRPAWPHVPAPRRVLAAVPRWRAEVRRSCRLASRSLAVTTPRSMQKRDRHASGPGQSRGHVSPWLARTGRAGCQRVRMLSPARARSKIPGYQRGSMGSRSGSKLGRQNADPWLPLR